MTRLAAAAIALALAAPAAAQARANPSGASATPEPSAPPGASQTESAQKPPPKAAHDVARALVPKEKWDHLLDAYATALSQQLGAAASRGGGKPPEDLEGKVRAQLHDEMKYQDTVDLQAQALANAFTPDELKQIAHFYQTSVGRKLVTDLPKVQSEVSDRLQQRLSQAVPRIVARVAPEALPGGAGERPGAEHPPAQGRTPPAQPKRP